MCRIVEERPTQFPGLFTSVEVQKSVRITQRRLGYWDDPALARPHGRPAQGSGSWHLYTLLDIIQLKLIIRLRHAGLSLQKIRQALVHLSDVVDEPAPLTDLEAITDGHRILIRSSNEQLLDPLARQYVLRAPLPDLLAELENKIASSPYERIDRSSEGLASLEVLR